MQENTKLKESLAKQDEELLILGRHSSVMQYEAFEASKARDRAEAKLAKLYEELKSLQAEHAELQEDHSILKEDQRQLEEKNSGILEELEASQASEAEARALVIKAEKGKLVAEEKFKQFRDLYKKSKLLLKEANAKAANYLHQLSFVSRVRDSAWADDLHLGFETFRTWWRDTCRKMDLNVMQIEDIPCTNETMRWLTSLGQKEMPDTAGIADFDYHPY